MQFYIEPEKLSKAVYGQERPGHKYTSRRPKAGGGYEYEYADAPSPAHTAYKDPEWRIHRIHDLRDVDWETGKRIPLEAGAGATCDRCGKEHAVVYHMEHKPTGKQVCVGSGCGPGMAGGTHNLDDASVKQAEKEAKHKVLAKARARLDSWVAQIKEHLSAEIQFPKAGYFIGYDHHVDYADGVRKEVQHPRLKWGFQGTEYTIPVQERWNGITEGEAKWVMRKWLASKIEEQTQKMKVPENWPFPKDLKTPKETVEAQALKIGEDLLWDRFQREAGYDRMNIAPKEMLEHRKPWEADFSKFKKSFDADDLYVAQDDFDLCMSWAAQLTDAGDFDRAMDLIKGAMHKYLRRYPSGKASPRWYYVYKVTSKHQGEPVKVGEKIKLTHEGQAGHYEVKNVHPNGYVTMEHDETHHQLSVKQEHLHEMFSEEHKGAIDTAHARLRQTFDAAKKYGSDAQKQRARDALRQHEERYQIKTPERMAGKKALQLTVLTHGEPSVENHTAAAKAHREAAKMGAPNAGLHEQLAEQHEIAAKSWMAQKASAEALKDPEPRFHVPANDDTRVDAPVLVLPKKENRGGKRAAKGAYFATKENAYKALKGASESNGTLLDNFAAADLAYRAWKEDKGPKPPPMEGGDLDHLNQALSLEKPKRVLGKQPKDPRVTSPAEAWDRLVSGAKRWDAATARHAVQVFQEWFQANGVPMHLPNEAHEAITSHYQAKADADYAAGMGGEHEQAQIHELTQQVANEDASFDPDEIEGQLDDSFDFGFNAEPETAQPLAMSADRKRSTNNDEYLPLEWAQKLISATPGYAGTTGVGEGIDPYLAAALKRTMTPWGVHAGKFFQEARNPSGPALDPRGEPLGGQASLEVLDAFLAKLPKGRKVEAQMDKSTQPHIFVVLPSKLHFLDLLEKAGGPYVGPRGGMWADPQHTQHWDPATTPTEPLASHEIPDKVIELTQLSHEELADLKRQQDEYLAKLNESGAMVPIAAMRLGRTIDMAIAKKGPRLVAKVPKTAPSSNKVALAAKLGKEAFARGIGSASIMDPALMKLLEGLEVGEAHPLLSAWNSAWHQASAAKMTEKPMPPAPATQPPKLTVQISGGQIAMTFTKETEPIKPLELPKEKPVPATKPVDAIAEQAKEASEGSARKIMPIGDHIFGSKKDLRRMSIESAKDLESLTYSDAVAIVQKRHLVPTFDLGTLKGLGQSPGTAHLTLALMASVVAKPGKSPESRARYVDDLKTVLASVQECKSVPEFLGMLSEMGKAYHEGENHKRVEDTPIFEDKTSAFAEMRRLQKEDPHRTYSVRYHTQARDTISQAASPYAIHVDIPAPYEALGKRFTQFITQRGDDARIAVGEAFTADNMWEKVPGKFKASLAPDAPTVQDGWTYLEARNQSKAEAAKATTPKTKPTTNKRGFSKAQLYAIGRGKAIRKGGKPMLEADERRTKTTFNLREIDYGTGGYMTQADREFHTSQLEAALHDLADIAGVPSEDLSFKGRLGIAMGAWGDKDSPIAHYVVDRFVINLTKYAGGGSLAHEWAHGLDNVISKMHRPAGNTTMHLSDVPDASFLPEHIRQAYGKVHEAMSLHPDPEKAKALHQKQLSELRAKDSELTEKYNTLVAQAQKLRAKVRPEIVEGRTKRLNEQIAGWRTELAEAQKRFDAREATRQKFLKTKPGYEPPGYMKAYSDVESRKRWISDTEKKLEAMKSGEGIRTEADEPEALRIAGAAEEARVEVNKLRDAIRDHAKLDPAISDWKRASTLLGEYFATPTEMFARAFECYVVDNMEKQERKNTYLASHARTTYDFETEKMMPDGSHAQPYPRGEERKRIVAAVGAFLRQIQESGDLKKARLWLESRPLQQFTIRSDMTA